MDPFWQKVESILPQVLRPGRYVGNELNIVRKNWEKTEVHFALAFPDVYEIGMSHIGMGILYHVLNRHSWIAAERVYSPWVDMEKKMRESEIPLFSLETRRPIRLFDVLGITLQYELQYTNVLNLLDLAGIPLETKERREGDPLVLAGGPCAYNPEPLADFLDAVVVGDGEEVVVEIADVVRRSKQNRWTRHELLKNLALFKGVYIPSFFQAEYDSGGRYRKTVPIEEDVSPETEARFMERLKLENYPTRPLVPLIEITHDRFSLEIMRGCTRGCRFCNAGMIYRPVRERSVEDLLAQTKEVLANTGYDEVSLVSLSTSDYTPLDVLLSALRELTQGEGVSISFPSLRPDTLTSEMAAMATGLRRSGLTLAPEAGTQRLRNVINKNNTEEDLFQAMEIAYRQGWLHLKLYFMVGLPTETREDVMGIVALVHRAVQLGKRFGRKEIHIALSPFSPKPQTPFQWEAQDSVEVLDEKLTLLTQKILWRNVKLSWRDPRVSRLETVFGRGDRRLGRVLFHAWKHGARFDAWSDQFRYDRWEEAFKASKLSMDTYTQEKQSDDPLPWDHLSKGISKSYLLQERQRAFSGDVTGDCRFEGCQGCGLMAHPACMEPISKAEKNAKQAHPPREAMLYGREARRVPQFSVKRKIRLAYQKGEEVRFTSHLDTVRIFERAVRRARVPVAMSQGFHPHLKMATGPPLPLGYTSRSEYLDMEVNGNLPRDFETLLNRHLPTGLKVLETEEIVGDVSSLNESITSASYRLLWNGWLSTEALNGYVHAFMKKNAYRIKRMRKGIEKEVDIRMYVEDISVTNGEMELVLRFGPQGTARVEEVVDAVLPDYENPLEQVRIERTGLYIETQGVRRTPLEIIREG